MDLDLLRRATRMESNFQRALTRYENLIALGAAPSRLSRAADAIDRAVIELTDAKIALDKQNPIR